MPPDLSYIEDNRIVREIEDNAAAVASSVLETRKSLHKPFLVVLLVALLFSPFSQIGLVAAAALTCAWLLYWLGGEWWIASARAGNPILRSGALGELAVLDALEDLGGEWVVLNQVLVPDARSSVGYREIDYVVIGPNGAFIVEAKSYKGHLSGAENDPQWTMLKIGRGGTPYTSSCRNPAKQVRVYIRLLGDALKGRGERLWLNGLVVFSRDNSLDDIFVQSVGVVQLAGMVDYLTTFQGHRVKDPKASAAAINAISDDVKRKRG